MINRIEPQPPSDIYNTNRIDKTQKVQPPQSSEKSSKDYRQTPEDRFIKTIEAMGYILDKQTKEQLTQAIRQMDKNAINSILNELGLTDLEKENLQGAILDIKI